MGSNFQDKSALTNKFTLDFLQHITNNFSEDRILGCGGGGVVYKGVLENGEEIALKKLNHIGLDDKEFTNEFNNIIRVHHQNIVQFVGYCYHQESRCTEYNGKYVFALEAEGILCFEYLHGGDLETHLSEEQPCGLDWQTCYKIIKGVCAGLNYLHSGNIYHLDLKPANILLDNNMMPKIGDFGISRIFPSTKTITPTTRTLIGTVGFMPPEYIDNQEISPKFDVFSLGVIIVQMMAGRKNYFDYRSVSSEKFNELVCEIWREKLDPTMLSHTWKEVKTCIGIALRCLEDDRNKRPTIREIVDELNRIDIENLSLVDETVDDLDRIGIDIFSLAHEATNLQSKVALAYNHYKNSASIGVHGSNNRFKSPPDPMDYEQASIMRNPKIRTIGGWEDMTRADDDDHLMDLNIRLNKRPVPGARQSSHSRQIQYDQTMWGRAISFYEKKLQWRGHGRATHRASKDRPVASRRSAPSSALSPAFIAGYKSATAVVAGRGGSRSFVATATAPVATVDNPSTPRMSLRNVLSLGLLVAAKISTGCSKKHVVSSKK